MPKSAVVTHTLAHPFTVGGKALSTISLRRPKVRDIIEADRQSAASSSQEAGDAALVAALAGLTLADISEMDAADYRAIQDKGISAGFFGPQRTSGHAS